MEIRVAYPDEADRPTLSIVVPVYNEEENVVRLYDKVVAALAQSIAWELIFVDDGSGDSTVLELQRIAGSDPRVRVVVFRRNYGQTPAMVAGIDHARGSVIVTMDGDLQNDPADIPRFLEKMNEGYDIVVGWREKRQDALITRKVPSWIANRLIGRITGVPIRDNGCSLKAYRSSIIQKVPLYSELHRFIPAMASLAGTRTIEIPVNHHARAFGQSKYGLKRIYKVMLDLIVVKTLLSSAGSPMRFFAQVSIAPLLLCGGFFIGTIFTLVNGDSSLVFLSSALIWGAAGSFSLVLGLLAELLYRTSKFKEGYLAKLTTRIDL